MALGVLPLPASGPNVPYPSITVTLQAPGAALLGSQVPLKAIVIKSGDGGSGMYRYEWTIDGTKYTVYTDTNTYTVPTGDANAKQITIRCTVTDTNDTSITDTASKQLWQVKANITCNGTVLGHMTPNVRVGEKANVGLRILPSAYSPNQPAYNWVVEGQTVKSYECTRNSARYTSLLSEDMQKAQVTFYWIHGDGRGVSDGLVQEVSCCLRSSDFANGAIIISGRVAVTAPDIRAALHPTFEFGPVNISQANQDRIFGLRKGNYEESGYSEGYNKFTLQAQGFDACYATVIEVSWQESRTRLAGWNWILCGKLDDNFGSCAWTDSPVSSLGEGLIYFHRDDHFSTYILCKPSDKPDAIWVPVMKHAWYWHGTATRSNDVFLLSQPGMGHLRYYGHEVDCFHLLPPEWSGYHAL